VRVIAATNKPLEEAVANKQFREDLFYRLNVVRIHLPALRERREDIRLLVNYFLKKLAPKPKSISPDVLRALEDYHWPGNVRELQNVMQRALVVAKGDAILPGDLPPEIIGAPGPAKVAGTVATSGAAAAPGDLPSLAQALFRWARKESKLKVIPAVERELIIEALKETGGNQVQAAKILGITRATLRKRIDKFKITQELAIR
jgi:DNA-binding NtrC family response regulator